MSEIAMRKLTLFGIKNEKHWKKMEEKLYFTCVKCGEPFKFEVKPPTILFMTKYSKCGGTTVNVPARIPIAEATIVDEVELTLE